jgi:transcriptional regulator with XRE-family HTH domain
MGGESPETFARRVRRLRQARGLSQEDLARRVGVSKTQVYLVESGRTQSPQPGKLRRYAQALGVSLDYLQYGHDPEPPDGGKEWPPLEVCLRHTSSLTEEDIAHITRIVRALEAEQRRELTRAQDELEEI